MNEASAARVSAGKTVRDDLLAPLDAALPVHLVNGVLKSLLATTENRNEPGTAAGEQQKKRRLNPIESIRDTSPYIGSPVRANSPERPKYELPKNTCYIAYLEYRSRVDLSPYEGCIHKVSKNRYSSDVWYGVPVHDDVNLSSPGSWKMQIMYISALFSIQEKRHSSVGSNGQKNTALNMTPVTTWTGL